MFLISKRLRFSGPPAASPGVPMLIGTPLVRGIKIRLSVERDEISAFPSKNMLFPFTVSSPPLTEVLKPPLFTRYIARLVGDVPPSKPATRTSPPPDVIVPVVPLEILE
jgi:hypothetical protein